MTHLSSSSPGADCGLITLRQMNLNVNVNSGR
jgi:hypothetical protein